MLYVPDMATGTQVKYPNVQVYACLYINGAKSRYFESFQDVNYGERNSKHNCLYRNKNTKGVILQQKRNKDG